MGRQRILDELRKISDQVQREFEHERRLLSFSEYLELFGTDPVRHTRDAARYLRDMFEHYGKAELDRPWGKVSRFRLFDLGFEDDPEGARDALVGQEAIAQELFRSLNNFVREGRPNRVLLMHGPNGSAKSTVASCIMRALEDYSNQDQGALYRFHWVFPNQTQLKGSIGFGGRKASSSQKIDDQSYAHLADEQIDARLFVEVRDHPLFLIPRDPRQEMLERLYREAGVEEPPPAWLLSGTLSHKSKQVYEALLSSYDGSLDEVLRHVQVERYFISRRYRVGAVTLGPQLSVDAGERQVTADRSLGALPASLQSVTLFEAFGELIDAAGGLLEFSDLLKRPLDAFKYLQITAETGEVQLRSQNVQVNCVLLASGNEVHLAAFREHPEFESFRGRLELIRVPYLLSYVDEQRIYDVQIAPQVRRHVAPHATKLAAMFAVLTRMRRPNPDRYEKPLRTLVADLTAVEKMDLYSTGTAPERLDEDSAKHLRSAIGPIYNESDAYPIYEGSTGASPREMRTVLLDAAQNPKYGCLSPLAVLDELDELCERSGEYSFLEEEKVAGGYHDHRLFRQVLRERLLNELEDELRVASGLVDETRYNELFDRYITQVSNWVKGEKIRNPLTGQYEDANEQLMLEVEALLGAVDKPEDLRHGLMNRVAAWAIDHPGQKVDNTRVFASQLKKMRDSVFVERRVLLARLARDMMMVLREEIAGLDDQRLREVRSAIQRLITDFGYMEVSVADSVAVLVRERFADLLH
jgi:serine protein kinase